MSGAPEDVIDTDLGSARHGHACDGVSGRIASRNRFAADTTSVKASPSHWFAVIKVVLARHQLAGIIKRDGPTDNVGGGRRANGSVLLNDLHGARGACRVGKAAHKSSAIDGDIPDVVVHPAFEVGKKWSGQDPRSTPVSACKQSSAGAVDRDLIDRHVGQAGSVSSPVAAAIRASVDAVIRADP